MLHPVNDFSVELLLDSDVRHARIRRGSVPVFFAGRKPNHIAGTNLLDRAAFALRPAKARCDDESLSKRMCMPCSPRTRFERYASTLNQRGIRCLEERIDAYVPREPIGRSLRGWLRASSFDFHDCAPIVFALSPGPYFADRLRQQNRTTCGPCRFVSTR